MAFDWTSFWDPADPAQKLFSQDNMNYSMLGVGTKAEFPAADARFKKALAWASDEQKLYYCTGAAWVAVSPGLSDSERGAYAWTQSKIVSGSRASGSGSGDLAISGAGFTPTAIIVFACYYDTYGSGVHMISHGFGDASLGESCQYQTFFGGDITGVAIDATKCLYCLWSSYGWTGLLKTLDADGCTLTLVMGVATTGTLYYTILFLR